MREYDGGYEDWDEYEEDGDDGYQDMERDEYEEEEEEEVVERPPPKKEVLEYLEMRQKLKEQARKKLARENGSASNKSSLSNFGSFFGPSQPVIADRVLQESKSLLETQHLTQKAPISNGVRQSGPSVSSMRPKNGVHIQAPKKPVKSKAEKLKATRDYSFLLSDDADALPPANDPPPRKNSDSRSDQVRGKSRDSSMHSGRHYSQGHDDRRPMHDDRRPIASNSQTRQRVQVGQKTTPGMSLGPKKQLDLSKQLEHRKQMVSSNGSGLARGSTSKDMPMRKPSSLIDKKISASTEKRPVGASTDRRPALDRRTTEVVAKNGMHSGQPALDRRATEVAAKNAMYSGQRPPLLKKQTSDIRAKQQQSREIQDRYRREIPPKQNVPSSKPQASRNPSRPNMEAGSYSRGEVDKFRRREDERYVPKPKPKPKPKARPGQFSDEEDDPEDALAEIRKMFGYNPSKYADMDEEDDRMMEADWRTIEREERKSALIAREEDERELKLIQEEEERERQRKLARKRKMGQR